MKKALFDSTNVASLAKLYLDDETDPQRRIKIMKWHLLNGLFMEFEDRERAAFHDKESDIILIDILAAIAKARLEKKKECTFDRTFGFGETYRLNGHADTHKEWEPVQVTLRTAHEILVHQSSSKQYHLFASDETILQCREAGLLQMVVTKLLRKRRNITVAIDRKHVGSGHASGWEAVLKISW